MKLKRRLIFALSFMFMMGTLCMSFNSKAEEQEENTYDVIQGSGGGTTAATTEAPTTASPTTEATSEEQVLEYIEINDVNFPDPVFRRYLSEVFDGDKDNIIKISDVTEIWIYGPSSFFESDFGGVTTLKGIEYFTELTGLEFSYQHEIKSVDLSKNLNLEELYCDHCNLTSLDVSNNHELTVLQCYINKLTSLDLTNNKKLKNLSCELNDISDLKLGNFDNAEVHCSHNELTVLDISDCNLSRLDCAGNNIKELDLRNSSDLRILNAGENQLETVKFGYHPNLDRVDFQNNNFVELSLANTGVSCLIVDYDTIKLIDVTNCSNLNSITLNMEATTGRVDLSKIKGLETIKYFESVAGSTIDYEKDTPYKTDTDGKIELIYNTYLDLTWVANSDQTWSCYDANGNMLKDVWIIGNDCEKRYIYANGKMAQNVFMSDGTYTYYLQYDGSPMKDRLTYHPDNSEVIYFDKDGHEVFNDFAHISTSISGEPVDDYCYFGALGYMYVDVVTYDKAGLNLYYANPYGVLERGKWFQFSDTVMCADGTPWNGAAGKYGYANADGTLMVNTYTYDWLGRLCYMQGNGAALY